MKHLNIIALVGLFAISLATGAEQGKHLFILSGQSNMNRLDPSISFTPTVKKEFGEENVIIVKDAKGGRPIRKWYKVWEAEKGNEEKATGELYERFIKKVDKAIRNKDIKTVTFVWMQGERDANEGRGNLYKDSLKGLIDRLEKDLDQDNINFVIGRISDFDMENKKYEHWTIVRKAQVEVAEESNHGTWVNTDDLNGKKDKLHYTGNGYKKLGKRFAEKAIDLIKHSNSD